MINNVRLVVLLLKHFFLYFYPVLALQSLGSLFSNSIFMSLKMSLHFPFTSNNIIELHKFQGGFTKKGLKFQVVGF